MKVIKERKDIPVVEISYYVEYRCDKHSNSECKFECNESKFQAYTAGTFSEEQYLTGLENCDYFGYCIYDKEVKTRTMRCGCSMSSAFKGVIKHTTEYYTIDNAIGVCDCGTEVILFAEEEPCTARCKTCGKFYDENGNEIEEPESHRAMMEAA